MAATQNYAMFATAETLGKTVRELLTGQAAPLTWVEQWLWQHYHRATARLQQQARPIHKVG